MQTSADAAPTADEEAALLTDVSRRDIGSLVALLLLGAGLWIVDGGLASLVLLALAIAVATFSPTASVAAIAGALPFIYQPVGLAGGQWSLLELAIIASALSITGHLVVGVARNRSLKPLTDLLRPFPITVAALLLVLVGAASLLTVADHRYLPESVREFRWVIVEPVIALVLFRWAFRRRGGRSLVVASFVGVAALVGSVGLYQILTRSGVVIADGAERATGPYRHPNNLALYLDRASVLLLALAIGNRGKNKPLVCLAVVCGLGLAATLSRGAALAYLVGACWVVWWTKARRGWLWIGVGVVSLVVAIAIAGSGRLTDSGSSGDTSSRVLIWRSSIAMIRDHPITGVGLDQFVSQYGRRYVDPAGWSERYTSHPHNLILDVWLRLGIAGLVVFAMLMAAVYWIARRPVSGRGDRALWIGGTGALLAGLAHGMLDNGFFLPDLAVMTWMLIALIESTNATGLQRSGDADG